MVKLKPKSPRSPPSPVVSISEPCSESSRGSVSSSEGTNIVSWPSSYYRRSNEVLVHVQIEHEGRDSVRIQESDSENHSVSSAATVGSGASVHSSDNKSTHTRAFPTSLSGPKLGPLKRTHKSRGSSAAVVRSPQTPDKQKGLAVNVIRAFDMSLLLEILITHSREWESIGIALGFSLCELEEIKAKPTLLYDAPRSWLRDMLNKWVQWTPEMQHGKYATLEDLLNALKSKTVGLAVVAEEVLKSFNDKGKLKLEYCTREQSSQDERKQLQLEPDSGKQLENVSQYTAKVSATALVPPNPTASPIDHYVYYLRCYFTRSREPAYKWPEIVAREYINNLAVVSNEYHNRQDLKAFRKATIHGSIDDILLPKAPIDFSDLLKPKSFKGTQYEIKRILLEGAPGIGKSTISWEICRKWGNGELFHEFSLIVLIKFRDSWVQNISDIPDLFRFPGERKLQRKVAKQINRTQGKGLLLILEGFDEAPLSLRTKDSLFFKLFEGSLLPNATVMVTSRPSASLDLRKFCKDKSSRRIEVLGFREKEISEYIEMAFSESPSNEREDFYKYLQLYPHISSMMYVPLNSAIVTHVYQNYKSLATIVPKTMTQLYTALVKTLLLRYMKEFADYKDYDDINDFSNLPEPILERFNQVCELAYQGITKPETQIIFSELSKDFDSLGLMQSVPELYIDRGPSVSHNFLHITIQEYLAAYHLSQLSEEEQVTFLEKNLLSRKDKLPIVSKFLAGLSPSVVRKVFSTKHTSTDSDSISMFELHLLFELHNPPSLSSIFGSRTISFNYFKSSTQSYYDIFKEEEEELYECCYSTFEYYVLGYCITCSSQSCSWKLKIEKQFIEIFTKGILSSVQQQHAFTCSGVTHLKIGCDLTTISCAGYDQVAEFVTLFPSLEEFELKLSSTSLHMRHFRDQLLTTRGAFNKMIKNLPKSLNSLTITEPLCEESYKALADLLASPNHSLKNLIIRAKNCSTCKPNFLQHISDGLSQNSSLKLLRIDGFITFSSSSAQTHTFNRSITSQEDNTQNSDPNSESISVVLRKLNCAILKNNNNNLVNLHFELCGLNDEDAIVLGEVLKGNSKLTLLNLRTNCIGDEGAIAIAKALEYNSALESLSLYNNHIGDEGATATAQMLSVNSTLINLDLRLNKLTDKGVMKLVNSVRLHNTTIKMLKLQKYSYESPPDCNQIQLSPRFCKRHPSIISPKLPTDKSTVSQNPPTDPSIDSSGSKPQTNRTHRTSTNRTCCCTCVLQ